jgi:ribonuclease P protein component
VLLPISRRDDFDRLHRQGSVSRAGPLRVRSLADPGVGVHVAFAARRTVGSAVRRNRLRRQAKAVIQEMTSRGELADGWYLVTFGDGSSDLGWSRLRDLLRGALGAGS